MTEQHRFGRSCGRSRWCAVALVLSVAGLWADGCSAGGSSHASAGSAAGRPAATGPLSVTIDPSRPGAPVPGRFVGLSFEASTLDAFARLSGRGDLVRLLRSLGPGLIRFGGSSADTRAAWVDRYSPRPPWASAIVTAQMLRGIGQLARRSGWQVLLTVGLAHYDPAAAAREVAAAHAALGRYLQAVEIGNEPDSFHTHRLRGPSWGVGEYLRELAAYRRAIARLTPGIALDAPDVSGEHAFERWVAPVVARAHPPLLTGHHYPLGCRSVPPASISRLLGRRVRRGESRVLTRFRRLSVATGVPFRLDETGSVSCGGTPGISDTFASALWALDIATRAMTTGLAGINFEGNLLHCNTYTPICASDPARLSGGALEPRPEWYALLTSSQLVGDRPIAVRTSPARADVDVFALLAPRGAVKLVVIDQAPPGARAAQLRIGVGTRLATARILALTAPSLRAHVGVRLGGAAVRADGSWSPGRLPLYRAHDGTIALSVPAASAALVTLGVAQPRGRAHRHGVGVTRGRGRAAHRRRAGA